jgi:hypothetical protein
VTVNYTVAVCESSACIRDTLAPQDFVSGQVFDGSLYFADGVLEQNFTLTLANDVLPEGVEAVRVTLVLDSASIEGGLSPTASTATITVEASDDGNGIVSVGFSSRSITVNEGQSANIVVERSQDFGNIVVAYTLGPQELIPQTTMSTNGTFSMIDGQRNATITVPIVDDTLPERGQELELMLTSVTGGARLSPGDAQLATIDINPSDNPHGEFMLESLSLATANIVANTRQLRVVIARSGGGLGTVVVAARVVFNSVTNDAERIANYTAVCVRCTVTFDEDDITQVLVLSLPNTRLEEDESFTVTLLEAALASESTIPAEAPTVNNTALSVTATPSDSNNALVVSLVDSTVFEGDSVQLTVSRGSGIGSLSAEVVIVPVSNQASSADLTLGRTTITLPQGVPSTTITIDVVDDTDAETREEFRIELQSVRYAGSDSFVVRKGLQSLFVEENDDIRGVFGFDSTTINSAASLQEGQQVALRITRQGGSTADAIVALQVPIALLGQATLAGVNAQGTVQVSFLSGDTFQDVNLLITDDAIPEQTRDFELVLTNISTTSQGATSPRLSLMRASLTAQITASDDPFGRIVFDGASRVVEETDGQILVQLDREAGTVGVVTVRVQLVNFTDSDPAGFDGPQPTQDFLLGSATVTFQDGQASAGFPLTILNDDVPETDETIRLALSQVTGAVLGPQTQTAVTIAANDVPRGTITVSSQPIFTTEGSTINIGIRRQGGLYDSVQVQWELDFTTATTDDVTSAASGTALLPPLTLSVGVPISIGQDIVPELTERFTFRIVSVSPGARLGQVSSQQVIIEANDDPTGLFAFPCAMRFGGENANGAIADTVAIVVERLGGDIGNASVQLVSTPTSTAETSVFTPLSMVLVFASGERSKTVELETQPLPDNRGRTIHLLLRNPQGASISTAASEATVTVYPNAQSKAILDQTQDLVCNGVVLTPEDIAGASPSRQIDVDSYILSLQELIPEVSTATVDEITPLQELIEGIFELLLRSTADASYEPLPDLLEEYGNQRLERLGSAFCPGTVAIELGAQADVELRTNTPADLNSALIMTNDDGAAFDVAISLPSQSNTGAGCESAVTVKYRDAPWFNPKNAFYQETETGTLERVEADVRIFGSLVASVRLPPGSIPSREDPVLITFTGRIDADHPEQQTLTCAFWDPALEEDTGAWSNRGCNMTTRRRVEGIEFVTCACDHATAFGLLLSEPLHENMSIYFDVAAAMLLCSGLLLLLVMTSTSDVPATAHMRGQQRLGGAIVILSLVVLLSSRLAKNATVENCAVLGILVHFAVLYAAAFLAWAGAALSRTLLKKGTFSGREHLMYLLLPLCVQGAFMAIHQGAYDSDLFGGTYGAVYPENRFCFIPAASVGSWVLAVLLPALLSLGWFSYQLARTGKSSLPHDFWAQRGVLYPARTSLYERQVSIAASSILIVLIVVATAAVLLFDVPNDALDIMFLVLVIVHLVFVLIVYGPARLCSRSSKSKDINPGETVAMESLSAAPRLHNNWRVDHDVSLPFGGGASIVPATELTSFDADGQGYRSATELPSYRSAYGTSLHPIDLDAVDGEAKAAEAAHYATAARYAETTADNTWRDEEFDDLIAALATGGSHTAHADHEEYNNDFDLSSPATHYNLRRESIADTHL